MTLIPSTLLGWVGLIMIILGLVWHRALSTIGLILVIGVGIYLYYSSSTTSSSS